MSIRSTSLAARPHFGLSLDAMDYGPYVPHEFGDIAEAHYLKHLGWLTAAVHCSIPWPQEDVRVNYDGDDYFLRGVKERNGRRGAPAVTMRCAKGERNAVLGKIYRFASILGWYKRGYVDIGGYMTGSHAMLYSDGLEISTVLASTPYGFNCNYLPLIRDEQTRRALAFWREGSRLRHLHAGYAFLSYFKVIESQFDASSDRVSWIAAAIPQLGTTPTLQFSEASKRIAELSAQGLDVGKHIYESGRCAIAHAQFSDGRGDPDVAEDRVRLARELSIVEALAHKYIVEVLKVPNEMDVYSARNRLDPLRSCVPDAQWDALRERRHISRRQFSLNGCSVGFAQWPHAPTPQLSELLVRAVSVRDGIVSLQANNRAGTIKIEFVLNFPLGKAYIKPYHTGYLQPARSDTAEDAIACVLFRREVIGNGRMELWLSGGGRMDFEVFIPTNIDWIGTSRKLDAEILSLRQLLPSSQSDETSKHRC